MQSSQSQDLPNSQPRGLLEDIAHSRPVSKPRQLLEDIAHSRPVDKPRPNVVEIMISEDREIQEFGRWIKDQLFEVGISRVGLTMNSVGYSFKEFLEEMADRGIQFVCVFTLEDARQRILSVKSLGYEEESMLTGPAEEALHFIRTNYTQEAYALPRDLRYRDSHSRDRDAHSRDREAYSRDRDAYSRDRDAHSRARHPDDPFSPRDASSRSKAAHPRHRDTHSRHRDTHSRHSDTQPRYKDTHSRYRDSYSRYRDAPSSRKEVHALPPDLRMLCGLINDRQELAIEEYDNFISFMVEYRESKIKEIHGTKVLVELLEPPLQPNKNPVVRRKELEVQSVLLNVLERNKSLLPLSTCGVMPSAPSNNRARLPSSSEVIAPFSERYIPAPAPLIDVAVPPPSSYIDVAVTHPAPYIDVGVPPPAPYIDVAVPPPTPYIDVAVPPPVPYIERYSHSWDSEEFYQYKERDYRDSHSRDRETNFRRRYSPLREIEEREGSVESDCLIPY